MNLFYVDTRGTADHNLSMYAGRHGDWQIDITATGTTRDMVDWQIVGLMHCQNMDSGHRRFIGLVWDESRILTDYDGVGELTRDEMDALSVAGFNLYNFMSIRGMDNHVSPDVEEAEQAEDFDALSFIVGYEAGELSEPEVIDGFQHLLDTGLVWQLQGSYGKTATAYLEAGLIHYNDRWA